MNYHFIPFWNTLHLMASLTEGLGQEMVRLRQDEDWKLGHCGEKCKGKRGNKYFMKPKENEKTYRESEIWRNSLLRLRKKPYICKLIWYIGDENL